MEEHLLQLLRTLESIGAEHEELYDSEVRETIGNVVMQRFVRHIEEYEIPSQLGMFTPDADIAVRDALTLYVERANQTADEKGIKRFHDRLNAFQNRNVRVNPLTANDYEDLFGHTPPNWYDTDGNVIWDRVR